MGVATLPPQRLKMCVTFALLPWKLVAFTRLTDAKPRPATTTRVAPKRGATTTTGEIQGPHHGWKHGTGAHPAQNQGRYGQGLHQVLKTLNPKPQVTGGPYHTEPIQGW
jgi:hypothetical protein